jgi:hypothetical protein
VLTPTSGFTADVYGTNSNPTDINGWGKPLAKLKGGGQRMRATLPGGTAYARYLVWITKLPPGHTSASISTIRILD